MKRNIGAFDGIVRLLLAIVLLCYAVIAGPWWIGLFSIIPIATAYAIWCPLYEMFGISTNKEESQHS